MSERVTEERWSCLSRWLVERRSKWNFGRVGGARGVIYLVRLVDFFGRLVEITM
jgi:hypothetical protein